MEEAYIDRKSRLLEEVKHIAYTTFEITPKSKSKRLVCSVASKISGILAKFYLGDEVEERAEELLVMFEAELEKENPDYLGLRDKSVKFLCLMHENISTFVGYD